MQPNPHRSLLRALRALAVPSFLVLMLPACSDPTPEYTLGGTLSGLAPGQSITLSSPGTDPLVLNADGHFRFARPLPYGANYAVTVQSPPTGQHCSVANGRGDAIASDVDTVRVTCALTTFSVGGTLSGLAAGTQLTLLDNQGDPLTLLADGPFRFSDSIPFNGSYAVTVGSQPLGQSCAVADGSGSGAGVVADVSSVKVVCSALSYAIGGQVSGLGAGRKLGLQDNGTDTLVLGDNGPFTFPARLPYGSSFQVTVVSQPEGQTCSVASGSGSGTALAADVGSVAITCSDITFHISGRLTGLAPGQQVTLRNNGGDALTLAADGIFSFATPVPWGGSYAVTVATQPVGQTCSVSQGQGQSLSQDVTAVVVDCTTNTYTIGGTLVGLATGAMVRVTNTSNNDSVDLGADGPYSLPTPVRYGDTYAVVVSTRSSPVGAMCGTTASATGTVLGPVAQDVTCVAAPFSAVSLQWFRVPGVDRPWKDMNAICSTAGLRLPLAAELASLYTLGQIPGIFWAGDPANAAGYRSAFNLGGLNQSAAWWPAGSSNSAFCVL